MRDVLGICFHKFLGGEAQVHAAGYMHVRFAIGPFTDVLREARHIWESATRRRAVISGGIPEERD